MDVSLILRKLCFAIYCSIANYAIVLRHLLIFNFDLLCVIAWLSFMQFLLVPCCLWWRACPSYLLCFNLRDLLPLLLIDAFLFLIANKLSVWQKILFSVPFLLRSKKNVIIDEDLVRIVSEWNILRVLLRMRIRIIIFKEKVRWVLSALRALYLMITN